MRSKADPAQARELLIRLVGTPSVTHKEDEACAVLEQALPLFGWRDAHIDAIGNVVAHRGNGTRELVLMGHIDTVPGGPEARVEGDTLWGRGSVDAKGPLCAFVVAGGRAVIPDDWKITLIAAVGEEGDSRGARHVVPSHSPSGCIIGEPSGTDGVTIGYRGFLRLDLSAEDGGAHRSGDAGPVTGCLMAAADILNEVERRDDMSKPVIERPSGAVIAMRGKEEGTRTGSVNLDIRLPIGAVPEEWAADFIKIAQKRGVRAELASSIRAHLVEKNDPLARSFRVAVRAAGLTPRLLAKGGTADFNLAAAWNCPLAAYGPGDSKLDHTADEHIDLNEYLTAITILTHAIEGFTR